MIEYQLVRSDRRTLSIKVDREGALVVHAPKHMSIQDIERFLVQKQRWITQKQTAARAAAAACPGLEAGAQVPFWGGMVTIAFYGGKKAVLQQATLWLPASGETVQHARKWRLQQAERLITPRVQYWAQRTGLQPARIAYGNAKSRWGSMNHRTRSLRLNAALVHCDPQLVDYVIVHELAHILHPDHSPAFHQKVRSFLPEADRLRAALKSRSILTTMWE
ncbi:MAG: M48 family metallopeptidase [Clostridia bacterium]|nr:M48 family metallopeptidase [Clostridia bacterium]